VKSFIRLRPSGDFAAVSFAQLQQHPATAAAATINTATFLNKLIFTNPSLSFF
jgi:hypothetical protein